LQGTNNDIRSGDIFSGLVDESGDFFICFEDTVGKGIKRFPVTFNDNDGKWCLNLLYTKPSLGHNHFSVRDRVELKDYCRDYFLMLRHNRESSLWTVICRSWHTRRELGMLELPTPHKKILTMEECLQ